MTMDAQAHWNKIYTEKGANAVSWYRPHLETSLELIERVIPGYGSSVIDVGGGESTLVDDLLARGYLDITVLDISRTAIEANKERLGKTSERVHWLIADWTTSNAQQQFARVMGVQFISEPIGPFRNARDPIGVGDRSPDELLLRSC